ASPTRHRPCHRLWGGMAHISGRLAHDSPAPARQCDNKPVKGPSPRGHGARAAEILAECPADRREADAAPRDLVRPEPARLADVAARGDATREPPLVEQPEHRDAADSVLVEHEAVEAHAADACAQLLAQLAAQSALRPLAGLEEAA